MNAPDRTPADCQAEAKTLVEWLFAQAAYYRKHAPDLTRDIEGFQDTAALLDSFRAGLELVDPHPAMRAELVRWVALKEAMPGDGEQVLLWRRGGEPPSISHFDGRFWNLSDGFTMVRYGFTHWAKMPAGPAGPTAGVATPSANSPEVAK